MKSLVNRNRDNLFKKKHYIAIIKYTVDYLSWLFGYKRKPYLFETTNNDGALMVIRRGKTGSYGIFYDYMQFKKVFCHLDFEGQEAYTMLLIAHEMRHYYQMRQLDSKTPSEPKERLELWRKDDENPKYPGEDFSVFDFFMQPMELDAELFAYVFVADKLDVLVNLDYIGDAYIKEMEKYYIELTGEKNEELFPNNQDTELNL